jgi:hypothetical protein
MRSDRRTASHRDQQQVEATDRLRLLVSQRTLAEVAKVTDAQILELRAVRPSIGG